MFCLRRRAAAAPAVRQLIDISYRPGPQQQTRRTLLQRANGADRRTDTVPSHRSCPAYHTGSANKKRGVVVRRMDEVNARRARLVPGWVTVFGRLYHRGM